MEILQMVDRMLKLANLNEISTTLILKVLKCLKGLKFGSSLMCRLPIMPCTLEIYLQSFPCSISCCFLSVQLKSALEQKRLHPFWIWAASSLSCHPAVSQQICFLV